MTAGWEDPVRAAVRVRLADVPEPARRHAVRVVADTIGVIVAGGRRPEVARLADGGPLSGSWRAEAGAQLLVAGGGRAEAERAAFLNATAGTFLELDEGYRPTGHPAIQVLPAALAAAQVTGASGRDLLAAFLAGYEVTAALFERYRLRYPLHPHGHLGAVGAAVAVAVLRGVDPVPPARVAATTPLLSTWQPCFEGATTRNTYTGHAAASGLAAHRLAEAGFTGSRDALDAAFGELAGQVGNAGPDVDPASPRITRNYLKLHSACALTHSALDALAELPAVPPETVDRVLVETVANNLKVDRPAAGNDLSTRFSLPYSVAAALAHGSTGPDAYRYDPGVAELASKVTVRAADDLDAGWPDRAPARVTVEAGGHRYTATVDNPLGHHSRPAPAQRLDEKFRSLVGEHADAVRDRLLALEDLPDCHDLVPPEALRLGEVP